MIIKNKNKLVNETIFLCFSEVFTLLNKHCTNQSPHQLQQLIGHILVALSKKLAKTY